MSILTSGDIIAALPAEKKLLGAAFMNLYLQGGIEVRNMKELDKKKKLQKFFDKIAKYEVLRLSRRQLDYKKLLKMKEHGMPHLKLAGITFIC